MLAHACRLKSSLKRSPESASESSHEWSLPKSAEKTRLPYLACGCCGREQACEAALRMSRSGSHNISLARFLNGSTRACAAGAIQTMPPSRAWRRDRITVI